MRDMPKTTGGKRSPDSSLLEWEFNNDMQYRLKKRFESLGFIVYLVNPNPEKGSEVSLSSRCARANSYWSQKGKPECLYISLHANAAGTGGWSTARGVEVYTASNASARIDTLCLPPVFSSPLPSRINCPKLICFAKS